MGTELSQRQNHREIKGHKMVRKMRNVNHREIKEHTESGSARNN